jgi:hypothetical protein
MCPACLTTAAFVAGGTTLGVGALGFAAVKFRWLLRLRRKPTSSQSKQVRTLEEKSA